MSGEVDQEAIFAELLEQHRGDPALTGDRLRLHVTLHTVAETQIATGDPPVTAETLDRLVAAGLDRHAAVHALCRVIADEMFEVLERRARFDPQRFARAMRAIEPESLDGA